MEDTDWQTSTTLLRRVGQFPTDEAAWAAFTRRYGRLVFRWCRQWGLQPADAEDVTQTVFVELAGQMRRFVYNPQGSFRAWLRTVAQRAWARFLGSRRAAIPVSADHLLDEAAGDDLLRYLEAESDRELLELAMARVRSRVQPHTWEAFRRLAFEGQSGTETAAALQMRPGAVFVARSKVQKMLRQEIERLSRDSE
ncbi:MAG: sigma-70 family RNA polymerase sigma factor [Gemmataceae bacterium]